MPLEVFGGISGSSIKITFLAERLLSINVTLIYLFNYCTLVFPSITLDFQTDYSAETEAKSYHNVIHPLNLVVDHNFERG